MTRIAWLLCGVIGVAALAVAAPAIEDVIDGNAAKPIADERIPAQYRPQAVATPMAERVATIGILNKRNGLSRDLVMKPGVSVLMNDVVVRLKACDQSAPWEKEQLTGAFVQVIVRGGDERWRRYFSGWLYKETPSLNVVEHPVYDVWVKACTMRHPDTGPSTVVLSPSEGEGVRSKERKSPEPVTPTTSSEPPPESAASNTAT